MIYDTIRQLLNQKGLDSQDKVIWQATEQTINRHLNEILALVIPKAYKISDARWRITSKVYRRINTYTAYYLVHLGCKGPNSKCNRFSKIEGYKLRDYGHCTHTPPEDIMTQYNLL